LFGRASKRQNTALVPRGAGADTPQGRSIPTPPSVLVIPATRRPIMPGFTTAITVTNPAIIKAIADLGHRDTPHVGVFLRKGGEPPDSWESKELDVTADDLHQVGTFVQIMQAIPAHGGRGVNVVINGHRRITMEEVLNREAPIQVKVQHWAATPSGPGATSESAQAYANEAMSTLKELVAVSPLFREQMSQIQEMLQRIDMRDTSRLADFAAGMTSASGDELQEVLEEANVEKRLQMVIELLRKELEIARLQVKINTQMEDKMNKSQREFLLREQLKQIKKELGLETDDKEALTQRMKERLTGKNVPEDIQKVIDEELEKLTGLEKNSSEFNVSRNYLEWLTYMPWGITSTDNFDLGKAREALDTTHYGLSDVKKRIMEFIAVGKLHGSVQGKIICLVGPPGVGKTSVGKSIASALDREFYRFSVGGLSDVSEIKGHRRTYVGAMPGKPVQCLKHTQTCNPVILIDEIDKLSRGIQGDPASALLELLDPGQNGTFVDHYLDVPLDLSKVLFICTANVMDTIPGPLQDRFEIIRLSGYDQPEKVEIAQKHIIPSKLKEAGLDGHQPGAEIDHAAVESLIRWYCREAGVRNLEKHISQICRKLALEAVEAEEKGNEASLTVTADNLSDYVGKQVFTSDRLYGDEQPPGVVMGLAWTAMGGSALYIEGVDFRGKGALQTTGQLGNVMQESSKISWTVAKRKLNKLQPDNTFFSDYDVHLHVPEGATPKDGPSAGVTMTTALLSLALKQPTLADLAMTGEISLTGKVLPVGGIKEKTIAARRAGAKTLIFPEGNRKDFEELPDYLKDGLNVVFANHFDTVMDTAFPAAAAAA